MLIPCSCLTCFWLAGWLQQTAHQNAPLRTVFAVFGLCLVVSQPASALQLLVDLAAELVQALEPVAVGHAQAAREGRAALSAHGADDAEGQLTRLELAIGLRAVLLRVELRPGVEQRRAGLAALDLAAREVSDLAALDF